MSVIKPEEKKIISNLARHNGYAVDAQHPTCLDISKLSNTKIDPTGNYVLTTRCRTGRSVRGFRLPPVIDFEERRKLETAIVKSLLSLQGINLKLRLLIGSERHPVRFTDL